MQGYYYKKKADPVFICIFQLKHIFLDWLIISM